MVIIILAILALCVLLWYCCKSEGMIDYQQIRSDPSWTYTGPSFGGEEFEDLYGRWLPFSGGWKSNRGIKPVA